MEQFYNKSDFESFLKNGIEDFIMIPQRKVWFGIYNHLHPQKKWPSIAASLVILISILHLGITNNKSINKERLVAQQKNIQTHTPALANSSTKITLANTQTTSSTSKANSANNIAAYNNDNYTNNDEFTLVKTSLKSLIEKNGKLSITISKENEINELQNTNVLNNSNEDAITSTTINTLNESNNITESISTDLSKNIATVDTKEIATKTPELKTKANQEVAIQLPKHQSGKIISYYITPSIGYRTINKKSETNKSLSNSNVAGNNYIKLAEFNNDESAINFEIGAMLEHQKNKKTTVKIGAQLNYTNYVTAVSDLQHPSQNVIAQTINQGFVPMDFDATPGDIKLNKTTLQVSVPIGVCTKLAGNEKISWHAGATAQPTFVFGGNAYVLSADSKNYVNEKSLLRRLNFNVSAETFVSFKTSKDIILNVGPQVRYQILSTYKKAYNYSEKLFNLGAKIGVSTNF
jgi:hypothetical protein